MYRVVVSRAEYGLHPALPINPGCLHFEDVNDACGSYTTLVDRMRWIGFPDRGMHAYTVLLEMTTATAVTATIHRRSRRGQRGRGDRVEPKHARLNTYYAILYYGTPR